jgi:hypothetical protein
LPPHSTHSRWVTVDGEGQRLLDLAVDRDGPTIGVLVERRLRHEPVEAHEHALVGRDVVIEQMRRRLGVEWLVVEDGQAWLALHQIGPGVLGEGGRDKARRHVAMERDRRAQHRAHGGEAGSLQESAAVRVRAAAEHDVVGLIRLFRVDPADIVRCPRPFDVARLVDMSHPWFLPFFVRGRRQSR